MPNERELKQRAARLRESICSATGERCECIAGGGCVAYRSSVDGLTAEGVLLAKTARLRALSVLETLALVDASAKIGKRRCFPNPEIRELAARQERIIEDLEVLIGSAQR